MGHVMFPIFLSCGGITLVALLFCPFPFFPERTVAIVGGVLRLANLDSHGPRPQCPLFFVFGSSFFLALLSASGLLFSGVI